MTMLLFSTLSVCLGLIQLLWPRAKASLFAQAWQQEQKPVTLSTLKFEKLRRLSKRGYTTLPLHRCAGQCRSQCEG